MSLRKPDTGEGPLEMVADKVPDGEGIELLRSMSSPGLKLRGDTHQRRLRLAEMGMQTGQGNRRLTGVLGSAPHRGHQPRPAGNRLTSSFWMGQSDEQPPPVILKTAVDDKKSARKPRG